MSPNVIAATANCGRETRHSETMRPKRINPSTAEITIVASTASGSGESTEATGRKASTTSPVIAPLARVRAPALWLSALRENEPPTG